MEPTPEDLLRKAKERGELDEEDAEKAEKILERDDASGDAKTFAGTLVEEGLVTSDTAHTLLQVLGDSRDSLPPPPVSDTQAPMPKTRVSDPKPPLEGQAPPDSLPAKASRVTSRKFRKGKRLGVGGMGEVMEATDPDLQRLVAIKTVLDPTHGGRRDRFLKEAHITGQLEHPNIIPVYELGFEENSAPYMVMKKVKGRSLDEVLGSVSDTGSIDSEGEQSPKKGGAALVAELPETPERSLAWLLGVFVKVCEAVAFAHSRKIIHRDLKPENIMVGEFGEVLVMDWGLAKTIGKPDTVEDLLLITEEDWNPDGVARTLDGTVVGTPAYMPPEQADGRVEMLDERSDVYSLGAILYEILALSPPFEGETVYKILHDVLLGSLDRPSEKGLAPWEVPRDLEAVVMKAMSRDPKRRYSTALELRDEVAAFFAGRRLSAATYSTSELLRMWAARNRAAVSTGLAMATILVIATVLFVLSLTRARNEALDQKDLAQSAEKTAREAEGAARKAEAEAVNQAERAETLRQAAEVRAAEGLILEADALLAADRRADAEARYVQAKKELLRLGEDPEGAVWGLMQVGKTSPPPLFEVEVQDGNHSQLAFSPDGKTLLTSGRWGVPPTLWETFSGRILRKYPRGRETTCIAFLPGGDAFLAGRGKEVVAIDLDTAKIRRSYGGHTGEVTDLALFKDGRRFASSAADKTVRVWDISTGETVQVLTDPNQGVLSVAVSQDGRSVVTYGDKCEAVLWDLGEGRVVRRIDPLPGWAYGHVAFVWGGGSFMVSSGSLMRRFDLYPDLRVQNFIEIGRNIRGIVPTPDGLRVITAGDQRRVKIWDLHTGKVESWRYGHTDRIGGLALSPDGALLATVGADHVLRMWNVREGEQRDLFRGHARPPTRIALTADDRLAASGSPMGIVRLWDVESGCEIQAHFGFGGKIIGVAISPEGNRIAAYGPGGLATWDTSLPDTEPRWLVGPGGPIMTWAEFSSDGKRLLTSGKEDRVWILWDVEEGRELLGPPRKDEFKATAAAFLPGETRCVAVLD
ncbi:MAG: WD40 repeat domain-containing serine/threonine protein kinase, partial [Planctomycetota bacterium]